MLLSVVVPCHNEDDSVIALCANIRQVMGTLSPPVSYQVILVDDGSTDSTAVLLKVAADSDEHVKALVFSRNFGKEAAMLAGLRASSGDYVVIMDADLQHPVEMIPRLLKIITTKPVEQVIAKRNRAGEGFWRSLVSRLYYRSMNSLVEVRLEDGEGDFRILSRKAVDALVTLDESNRFSKGLFAWIGFPTDSIEYENVVRSTGRSSWSVRSLLEYGIDSVLSFNTKPLRSIIYVGGTVFSLAVLYLAVLFIRYVSVGAETPGYITTIAVITLFGGVQLLSLGIIGEYIGRLYQEAKHRPHYLINERYGFTDEK